MFGFARQENPQLFDAAFVSSNSPQPNSKHSPPRTFIQALIHIQVIASPFSPVFSSSSELQPLIFTLPSIMAAPSREGPKAPINRQTTAPFHLKLFYRVNNYNPLSDYSIPPPSRRGGPVSGSNAIRPTSPVASTALPPHLEIYTWHSCTLRELSQLLTSALPSLLPDPPVGTRLCFRLIYPDARGAAMGGPDARGRYLSRDLGSAIVGPRDSPLHADDDEDKQEARPRPGPLRFQGSEADRPLQDARFIVGDYIECAILPPLEDGSVAPALNGASGPIMGPRGGGGGGMRAFRDNGYPRGPGRGPRGGGSGPPHMPRGDWHRGERLPEGGRGRRGWAPY